eukprot:490446-Pelagomonas_calceolata.AAC.4
MAFATCTRNSFLGPCFAQATVFDTAEQDKSTKSTRKNASGCSILSIMKTCNLSECLPGSVRAS